MRFTLFLAALLGGLTFSALSGETEDRAELKKMEEQMTELLAKNDIDALLPLLSTDWKLVLADGNMMTRTQLSDLIKSGKLRFSADRVDEMDVRLYGDAAVIIGITSSRGAWEGSEFSGRDRFTDIFVRKDGKWICVSSHSSDLANSQ